MPKTTRPTTRTPPPTSRARTRPQTTPSTPRATAKTPSPDEATWEDEDPSLPPDGQAIYDRLSLGDFERMAGNDPRDEQDVDE